jgi:hypothetical protein
MNIQRTSTPPQWNFIQPKPGTKPGKSPTTGSGTSTTPTSSTDVVGGSSSESGITLDLLA